MKYITREDLNYIAGFVDGEGYITFRKNSGYYILWVSIGQSNLEVLEWVKKLCGGSIYKAKKRAGHKQMWDWRTNGNNAFNFLDNIQDFLQVKKEVCRLCMEAYLYSVTNFKVENRKNVQEYYWENCKQLNKGGIK